MIDQLEAQCVRRVWLILGVALALLWGVPPSAAAPANQTITGYVQNADLRRVAQATVELRDQEGTLVTSATTNDAGGFLLITPRDGVFSVQAVQDTYHSEHVVINIGRERPDPVVLTLTETKDIALEIVAPLLPIKPNSSSETYSVSRKDIEALPRGNNLDLHDVLVTIPSAAYGSLKQVHIRQDHANLQFRIDGVPIPDTVTSQFTDLLSPRAWERADISLGGMEAQYGNRTAAVIDITSKSGTKPGFGTLGVFGGSNETVLPSFEYGGTAGDRFRFYVMNNYRTTNRAIDPPTLGQSIFHGHGESNQTFLRGDYQVNNRNNVTWLLLNSVASSQIPTQPGQRPHEEIVHLIEENTDPNFMPVPSEQIDENQVENNQYSHLVWRHDMDAKQFVSVAGYFRHSRATFTTDPLNVLAYTSDEAEPFSAGDQDRWVYAVCFGYLTVKERLNSELEKILERRGIVKAILANIRHKCIFSFGGLHAAKIGSCGVIPLVPMPRVRMGRIEELHVRMLEEPDQQDARQEPADMREKRHAAAFGTEAHAAAQDLHQEPKAQHDRGWDIDHLGEKPQRDEHQHLGARVEQQIGAEDPRDGATGPYHGNCRNRVNGGMTQRRDNPAQEIEDNELSMPHDVFNVVPENPQVQHIPDQVHPAAVKKHTGDQTAIGRHRREFNREFGIPEHDRGDGPILIHKGLPALLPQHELVQEDDDAGNQKPYGHDGFDIRGVVVTQWNHEITLRHIIRRSICYDLPFLATIFAMYCYITCYLLRCIAMKCCFL